MTDPFRAGSVWWGLMDFDGQRERRKYLVFLNDCTQDGERFVAAMTTSGGAMRYVGETASPCGCPAPPCYRIDQGQEACFSVTTWVQFDNVHEIGRAKLETWVKQGKAGFLQMLANERIRSVLNCAKKSKDIAKRYLVQIEQTLKSMNSAKKAPAPGPVAPTSAPSAASAAIEAVRVRFESRCANCRSELTGLLGLSEGDLEPILAGSKPPPADFVPDVEAGFEIVASMCRCAK